MRATKNPALPLALSDDSTRRARRYLVAEFDMQTHSGLSLTDLSGNGNNATFSATPTFTSEGVSFNGTYYADFALAAALSGNYTFMVVMKGTPGGYAVFGSRNDTDNIGAWLRNNSSGPMLSSGAPGNDVYIGPALTSGAYVPLICKICGGGGPGQPAWAFPIGQARGRVMGSGDIGYRNTLRPDGVLDTRTRWRIGGGAQTSGGNHDTPYLLLDTGTIAYIMLFSVVTGEDHDGALLEYVAAQLAPRGIVL